MLKLLDPIRRRASCGDTDDGNEDTSCVRRSKTVDAAWRDRNKTRPPPRITGAKMQIRIDRLGVIQIGFHAQVLRGRH